MTIEQVNYENKSEKNTQAVSLFGTSNVKESTNKTSNTPKKQKTNKTNIANGALFSAINTLKL